MSYTFSNLNLWRKVYLIFVWVSALLTFLFFMWAIFLDSESPLAFGYITIPLGLSLFALWKHYAIINRKLGQIYFLAIISFIPLMSLIGALIMLSIARVTKKELKELTL